jgi:hypothetical protein
MPLDYEKIKNWPLKSESRSYTRTDCIRYARGFGAGLPGVLEADDRRFIDPNHAVALPMMAVALADGELWQRDPAAGLQWKQIIHVEEGITVHGPLEPEGTVTVERRILEIYDWGVDKGALVQEQQTLRGVRGELLVTIDVSTILRGEGGFGVNATSAPASRSVPADNPPHAILDLPTPSGKDPVFGLSDEFDVTAAVPGLRSGQSMLRGLCAFGLAGRAVLKLVCDNEPRRLRRLSVRYAGPVLTDETLRIQLWHTGSGTASFRVHAVERDAPVLKHCQVEFAC